MLKEVGQEEGVDWVNKGQVWGYSEHCNEPSGSIKFLD